MHDQTLTAHRLDTFASPMADPVVVHLNGTDAVVLTTANRSDVSVWSADAVISLPASIPAEPVTDPDREAAVLRKAVASLNELRQQAVQAAWTQRNHQLSLLDDIRSYAIEAHEAGDICQDGLNEFLRTFDLPEYYPQRVRVAYTLGGTFTVAATSEARALTYLANALRPSFEQVDDVDSETTDHEVMLRLVTPTTLGDGRCGFNVAYAISGTYVVDHDDAHEARTDCIGYLRPDLDDIADDLVPGTDRFTVETVTTDYDD
jgi:hypothetical protein